ncbi:hypothetical protein M422DRAFT_778988 [Sphaerobolus stellatus SS14]|uniref:Uncharacterized protein n=1 Tax=Sphaerobolus stellatus (strain SS14) TaxID=990650 RepID=A0A0C9W255_SPHS4|nr:hypothetical protein M422DRAFT_778988 [Sphaerobolus stellatus SS14]
MHIIQDINPRSCDQVYMLGHGPHFIAAYIIWNLFQFVPENRSLPDKRTPTDLILLDLLVRWTLKPPLSILPGMFIALALRFGYQRLLDKSGESEPTNVFIFQLHTVPSPDFGEGVVIPKNSLVSLPKLAVKKAPLPNFDDGLIPEGPSSAVRIFRKIAIISLFVIFLVAVFLVPSIQDLRIRSALAYPLILLVLAIVWNLFGFAPEDGTPLDMVLPLLLFRWTLKPLLSVVPRMLIALALRFDYQRFLDKSEGESADFILERHTATAPELGESVVIPKNSPGSFPKVYYITALLTWAISHSAFLLHAGFDS